MAPLELFSLQNDPSRTLAYVSDVFEGFWSSKTRLGAQNAFWSNFCTSAPQNHQETSDTYDKKRVTQDWRTFSSKVLLGSTWGTLGPAGAEAGWLAAEGSELRAEGSELRAQS